MGARTFAGLYTERFHQARNELLAVEKWVAERGWDEAARFKYGFWSNELVTMRGVLRDLQRLPAGKVTVSRKLLFPPHPEASPQSDPKGVE